jgi:hypothetical protein
VHACAAIRHSCKDATDYVDDFYFLEIPDKSRSKSSLKLTF